MPNPQVTDSTPIVLGAVPLATSFEFTTQDAAGVALDQWHDVGPGLNRTVGEWLAAFPAGATYKLNARGVNGAGAGPPSAPFIVDKVGAPVTAPTIALG